MVEPRVPINNIPEEKQDTKRLSMKFIFDIFYKIFTEHLLFFRLSTLDQEKGRSNEGVGR